MKMTSVCPFVKASRPDDASSRKLAENSSKHQAEHDAAAKAKKDSTESAAKCPFGYDSQTKKESNESAALSPKCPFGYDSQTFKLGPLSCLICQALLFESSKCVPCSHVYCKACISRFKDCPLCGADIERIETDTDLQNTVERFIEGHARIKRPHVTLEKEEDVGGENKNVIYEDVSMERGAFLVQQAMRVSLAGYLAVAMLLNFSLK